MALQFEASLTTQQFPVDCNRTVPSPKAWAQSAGDAVVPLTGSQAKLLLVQFHDFGFGALVCHAPETLGGAPHLVSLYCRVDRFIS